MTPSDILRLVFLLVTAALNEPMEFTGERFVPEQVREIWYEHWHRYVFARDFTARLRVLDCACGEGYGADLLAATAAQVTGVDRDPETIAHASNRYGARGNLSFESADCTALPFDDGAFDAVVSFETIEHIEEQEAMLAEFARVLTPEGFVILSSPDKKTYSDDSGFRNEFHVRELYRDELTGLVEPHFPAYRLYGQKLLFHSAIWPLQPGQGECRLVTWSEEQARAIATPVQAPLYFLLIGARRERWLPEAGHGLWLFDDAAESIYAHYNAEVRHHINSGIEFQRMQARIRELENGAIYKKRRGSWWKRVFGKQA